MQSEATFNKNKLCKVPEFHEHKTYVCYRLKMGLPNVFTEVRVPFKKYKNLSFFGRSTAVAQKMFEEENSTTHPLQCKLMFEDTLTFLLGYSLVPTTPLVHVRMSPVVKQAVHSLQLILHRVPLLEKIEADAF